jgi:hypothetical protein
MFFLESNLRIHFQHHAMRVSAGAGLLETDGVVCSDGAFRAVHMPVAALMAVIREGFQRQTGGPALYRWSRGLIQMLSHEKRKAAQCAAFSFGGPTRTRTVEQRIMSCLETLQAQ